MWRRVSFVNRHTKLIVDLEMRLGEKGLGIAEKAAIRTQIEQHQKKIASIN